jgi:hypothetical protein
VIERDILRDGKPGCDGCQLGGGRISLALFFSLLLRHSSPQPQQEGLQELASCLQQTTLGNSEVQAQVREVS